jgi:hypothetical protein
MLGIEGEKANDIVPESDSIEVFSDEQAWDVLEDIPNDSAAARSSSTTGPCR